MDLSQTVCVFCFLSPFKMPPTIAYSTVGQYIRFYRNELNVTKGELAKATHVTRQTIANIERDATNSRWQQIISILQFLREKSAPPFDLYCIETKAREIPHNPINSIDDLYRKFPDNISCLKYIFDLRFKNPKCPKCGRIGAFHLAKANQNFVCNCGQYSIFPKKGTIFGGSPTPLTKWFLALYLIGNNECGVSAREIQRDVGMTYKAAYAMRRKIMAMILREMNDQITPEEMETMKRKIRAKHQYVSQDLEHQYIAEFSFRNKYQHTDINPFFRLLLMAIAGYE